MHTFNILISASAIAYGALAAAKVDFKEFPTSVQAGQPLDFTFESDGFQQSDVTAAKLYRSNMLSKTTLGECSQLRFVSTTGPTTTARCIIPSTDEDIKSAQLTLLNKDNKESNKSPKFSIKTYTAPATLAAADEKARSAKDHAKQGAEDAKDAAKDAARDAKDKIDDEADKGKEQGKEDAKKIKGFARRKVDQIKAFPGRVIGGVVGSVKFVGNKVVNGTKAVGRGARNGFNAVVRTFSRGKTVAKETTAAGVKNSADAVKDGAEKVSAKMSEEADTIPNAAGALTTNLFYSCVAVVVASVSMIVLA